jgi:uncharacterized protein (DUF1684 family)
MNGCGPDPSPYELAVLKHRFDKNVVMADPAQTVLMPDDRAVFKGLTYYTVDSSYRFVVPILRADSLVAVPIRRQQGEPASYVRLGQVEIPFSQATCSLSVFVTPGRPDIGWIPFTDLTSGNETYAGGRYLDVRLESDSTTVDFNYAYNPFCVYNPEYICGIPPEENDLPLAIRAGEMMPTSGTGK